MCARRRISDNAIVAATADRAVPLLFGASVRDGATPRQTSGRPRSPTATAPARSPSAFVRRSSTIDARGSVLACAPATSVPRCGAEDGLDGVVRPGPVRGGAADDEDFALFGHVGSGSCRGRVTVHVRITSWPFGVRGPSASEVLRNVLGPAHGRVDPRGVLDGHADAELVVGAGDRRSDGRGERPLRR